MLVVTTMGSGLLTLLLGQDVNFDQLHYHVYLGWSILAGRLGQDVAPAGPGSYLNPLLHVPSYLGIAYLPPRVFGFVLGAVHGLNAYFVYRLARQVLRDRPDARAHAALAGAVAMGGPSAVSLLGTTFGDNLLSIPVLAAFLLATLAVDGPPGPALRALLGAGLLGGVAVGLKLTFGPFALGLGAASIVIGAYRRSWLAPLVVAAGGAAGALLAGGYWAWQMWSRFSNPLFPFANAAFPSSFDGTPLKADWRWASERWGDVLAAPVEIAVGLTGRMQEVWFRDVRYLCAVILVGVALAVGARLVGALGPAATLTSPLRDLRVDVGSRALGSIQLDPVAVVLVVGWLASYVVWVRVFHYYRYFAAGEFLAPLVILALLATVVRARLPVLWPLVALTILVSSDTGTWGRMPWRDQPLALRYAAGAHSPGPAVVVVDGPSLSYVLPFLPAGSRFFGTGTGSPGLDRLVAREVRRHPGRFFRLIHPESPPSDLGPLGLVEAGPCLQLRTGGRGRLQLCPLTRE